MGARNLLNTKRTLFLLITIFLCWMGPTSSAWSDDVSYHKLPDQDLAQMLKALQGDDHTSRENMVLRIQWAGIADQRIIDPLLNTVKRKSSSIAMSRDHARALIYSGHHNYQDFIMSLRKIGKHNQTVQKIARKEAHSFPRHAANTRIMNSHPQQTDRSAFWIERYKIALPSRDTMRMRLAARDLKLLEFDEPLFDLAADFLAKNHTISDDPIFVDGLAYICVALGMTKKAKYQTVLIDIANNSHNEKLAKYARNAVVMNDRNFKSTNRVLGGSQ